MTTTRPCRMEGCAKVSNTFGLCTSHLSRYLRTGDPATDGRPKESIERYWSRFRRDPSGCWIWTGSSTDSGYGHVTVVRPDGRRESPTVHREFYRILVGPIPDGLVIDHLCGTKLCVNPSHLEPVTQAENLRRARDAAPRTHCPHGHVYDEENTYVSKRGGRKCRTCHRDRVRRSKVEQRAAAS